MSVRSVVMLHVRSRAFWRGFVQGALLSLSTCLAIVLLALAVLLAGCNEPAPRAALSTAPAISTRPLGDSLSAAQVAQLSSAEKIRRLRALQAQDPKYVRELINSFPPGGPQ